MWPFAFGNAGALFGAGSVDAVCCGMASTRDRRAPAFQRSNALATPNYGYEKRQRELAKKRKAEEKKQKKLQAQHGEAPRADDDAPADAAPEADTPPPAPAA